MSSLSTGGRGAVANVDTAARTPYSFSVAKISPPANSSNSLSFIGSLSSLSFLHIFHLFMSLLSCWILYFARLQNMAGTYRTSSPRLTLPQTLAALLRVWTQRRILYCHFGGALQQRSTKLRLSWKLYPRQQGAAHSSCACDSLSSTSALTINFMSAMQKQEVLCSLKMSLSRRSLC